MYFFYTILIVVKERNKRKKMEKIKFVITLFIATMNLILANSMINETSYVGIIASFVLTCVTFVSLFKIFAIVIEKDKTMLTKIIYFINLTINVRLIISLIHHLPNLFTNILIHDFGTYDIMVIVLAIIHILLTNSGLKNYTNNIVNKNIIATR